MKKIFIKNNTIGFRLSLASPNLIIKWSLKYIKNFFILGEVIEPFTINFKTGYPEPNGLFCERIFGPLLSWKCRCGINFINYTNINTFCNFCGVEININQSRRWRMGFINLATPIAHKWYVKDILSLLLHIPINELKILLYYKIFSLFSYKKNQKQYNFNWIFSKLLFISEWFKQILKEYNLLNELVFCKEMYYELYFSNNNIKKKLLKKLSILHLFLLNNINPEWLFLTVLPVIPAGLRPLVKIKQKLFVSSLINNLYKIIILRNNRLKRWKILRHSIPFFFELIDKQLLQCSIDDLLNIKTKPSSSNCFTLQGKKGKFRQYILGKRIDFSGRSVILPGSDLIYKNIGLPLNLSLDLFKPMLLNFLKKDLSIITLLRASYITQYNPILLKRILKFLITKEIVLLNRAPTLHRMNIQAFKPYLIEFEGIKLYPVGCSSFNADFDGDQMGLFLILSKIAKQEAKKLMAFDKNIFSPTYLRNMFKLSQSIILGISTLLNLNGMVLYNNTIFANLYDVISSFFFNLIKLDSPIWIRCLEKNYNINIIFKKYILSTLGRILLQYYLYLFN
ncbi:RNA polymerase beta' chain (apicoplast) [Toxoplasma gondii RH]|uniref:DNA-directed RNA polymerase subunit n=2 Tax=Toxoplasma gondii TaxID=5811 RepID=Q9MTD4_TOXGO|nr:RNA polymerase beta' chain [Toxoplasma gondii RH]AAD41154.1 RNA polymerase C1 [Toxoplasma gondii]|eukprot:NP_044568.1 RNA polymerase beta' chain (apicoplast) [Toxoplasma gondii RH]